MGVLSSGRPMRYTEVMKALDMDAALDSSKFAYHMAVLTEAGIAEKVDDSYRITQGGKEIFKAMVKVAEGWPDYQYQDSLKRMKGGDVNRLLWSITFLDNSYWWIVGPFLSVWLEKKFENTIFVLFGFLFLFLLIGVYWYLKLKNDFWNPKWGKFFYAAINILGKNGIFAGFIKNLNNLIVALLLTIGYLMVVKVLSIDLFTFSLISGCFILFVISICLSRRLSKIWDDLCRGLQVSDFSTMMDLGYRSIMVVFFSIGMLSIFYMVSESEANRIILVFGPFWYFFKMLWEYRKY